MQPREPGAALKTYRKASALVRWVALVVISGLALAALLGIAISALVTAIQDGF
jgi:hypothetical protein